jgi:hypothetical protein
MVDNRYYDITARSTDQFQRSLGASLKINSCWKYRQKWFLAGNSCWKYRQKWFFNFVSTSAIVFLGFFFSNGCLQDSHKRIKFGILCFFIFERFVTGVGIPCQKVPKCGNTNTHKICFLMLLCDFWRHPIIVFLAEGQGFKIRRRGFRGLFRFCPDTVRYLI